MIKPGAWLINVARGRLVDERALLRALRDGQLGGAVLDTIRDEPLPPMSPFYDAERHRHAAHVLVERPGARPQHRALLREPPPLRGGRAAAQRRRPGRRLLTDADRDRRACRERQVDRLQHADPRPRRDRRVRRGHAQRRRRQGPRRAARPAGRDLQARRRSSMPTSPTSTCPRRRPRPRAASGPRAPGRPPRAPARLRRAPPRRPRLRRSGASAPGRDRRSGPRPRAARARVHARRPGDDERRLERLAGSGRHGTAAEREANEREEAVLGASTRASRPARRPRPWARCGRRQGASAASGS